MTDDPLLFRNKYRIPEIRLRGKNYAEPGWYFVTICTKDRVPWFGRIQNGRMWLTDIGCIAYNAWVAIPDHFPYVTLDAFVVMPDHVHGIVRINAHDDVKRDVEARHGTPPPPQQTTPAPSFQLKPGSLGSIINQYKSTCTRELRKQGQDGFALQPRFYERIIRDDRELLNVRQYIVNNPANWGRKSGG